ncbi:L-type lectin-domain containing protein [Bacillus sp. NPDC094077]|uniref:L-type lectin-domain containing protein n=1 Tax=Bacillus sp. NPDC094077 TaxID=3390932 RepID=UPI003CFE88D9
MHKAIKMSSLALLLGTSLFLSSNSQVFASEMQDSPPSAIKLDNIFTVPSGSNSTLISNDKFDIVQLTDSVKDQSGAVWSTNENKMDLTKDFEAAMYIYFGDSGEDSADGMAFVMHNDPNGNAAFRTGEGARIGVWDSTEPKKFGMAIMNSFAVEFDTYFNKDFDRGVPQQDHIAWNYPGKKETYDDNGLIFKDRRMIHNDLQFPGLLSDDTWRYFTVNWDSKQSVLTYQLEGLSSVSVPIDVNDVFGTTEVYWGFTGSTGGSFEMNRIVFDEVPGLVEAEVKEDILDSTTNESVVGTKVASGTQLTYSLEANYIGGKQAWKNINVSSKIDSNVSYVPGSLRLKDASGKETPLDDSHWKDGTLNVPISDMDLSNAKQTILFDVKTGQVGQDTVVSEHSNFYGDNYHARASKSSYTISANKAPEVSLNQENETIKVPMDQDVEVSGKWKDEDGTKVTITYKLNGEVIGQEQLQSDQENTFQDWKYTIPKDKFKLGDNHLEVYVTDEEGANSEVKSLQISISSPPKITLTEENKEVEIDYGKGFDFSGTVSDLDGAGKELTLYYVIGDNEPVAFTKVTNSTPGKAIEFAGELPTSGVNEGPQTISVYAVDEDNLQSNIGKFTLHVIKRLTFADEMKDVEFVATQIGSTPKISERATDYPIHIINSKGKGSKWKIKAELTKPLVSKENHTLEGLFFKKSNGETEELLLNTSVIVESGESPEDYSDINLNWKNDEGLLLKVDPSAHIGSYAGELTWTLEDAP